MFDVSSRIETNVSKQAFADNPCLKPGLILSGHPCGVTSWHVFVLTLDTIKKILMSQIMEMTDRRAFPSGSSLTVG